MRYPKRFMKAEGFTPAELRLLRRLDTPFKVQSFLDREIAYNQEADGDTCLSPRRVLRERVAQCIEGALFAAAALRVNGREPLVLDMEAVRDSDHVIAVYKHRGHWGSVGQSNYAGLRCREPVYRTLRELAMSYFEHYFNPYREKTLRSFSRPVNLKRFDRIGWMTSEDDLWEIPEYLLGISHTPMLTPAQARSLNLMDDRLYAANCVGTLDTSKNWARNRWDRAAR